MRKVILKKINICYNNNILTKDVYQFYYSLINICNMTYNIDINCEKIYKYLMF